MDLNRDENFFNFLRPIAATTAYGAKRPVEDIADYMSLNSYTANPLNLPSTKDQEELSMLQGLSPERAALAPLLQESLKRKSSY